MVIWAYRHAEIWTYRHTGIQAYGLTVIRTYRPTDNGAETGTEPRGIMEAGLKHEIAEACI